MKSAQTINYSSQVSMAFACLLEGGSYMVSTTSSIASNPPKTAFLRIIQSSLRVPFQGNHHLLSIKPNPGLGWVPRSSYNYFYTTHQIFNSKKGLVRWFMHLFSFGLFQGPAHAGGLPVQASMQGSDQLCRGSHELKRSRSILHV